jgi:hypothetical protein
MEPVRDLGGVWSARSNAFGELCRTISGDDLYPRMLFEPSS